MVIKEFFTIESNFLPTVITCTAERKEKYSKMPELMGGARTLVKYGTIQ